MRSTLDAALDRFHRHGPEYGDLTDHGPMVAEALVALGREPEVAPWVEAYAPRLGPCPAPREAIRPAGWSEALGRFERFGDWAVLFRRELAEAPWRDVLARWLPRLAPGLVGAAAHVVIRAGHAARALSVSDTGPRREELAVALAYWAARYERLPVARAGGAPAGGADAALRALPLLAPDVRARFRLIVDAMPEVGRAPGFPESIHALDAGGDLGALLSDVSAAFARSYLVAAPRGGLIAMVHAITAPSAVRLLLCHAREADRPALVRHGWHAAAALHVAYGGAPVEGEIEPPPDGPEEIVDRALASGDEHAIKMVEACLREHAVRPDPVYLAAAHDAATRFEALARYRRTLRVVHAVPAGGARAAGSLAPAPC